MNYIVYKNENALYYECKYSCDNAIFLKLGKESYFITDGRYELDAKESIKDTKICITNSLINELANILKKNRIKKVTIDPTEWDISSFNALKDSTPTKLINLINFSHKKRIIKSSKEINKLKTAVDIGKKTFKKISYALSDLEGSSEFDLNFLAESMLRDYGKRDISFEPILAISENAAKPHAMPTKRELKRGDLVLLDAGVKYKRYCSDRTRTAIFNDKIHFSYKQKFKSN